jgi:glycosyltransferase involved in cell wall biosynthesis
MNPRAGGPCQGIRNLFPHVRARGNTVEVVCLDEPDSDYLAHEPIPVHALGTGLGPWGFHPGLRPWLEKNLPRFDAVILNGLWQYPGFLMSSLSRRKNFPPYFVFPHGMLDPWFQRSPDRRMKAIRNWFYWKIFEHQVIANARALCFTCGEEMRLARGTFHPYRPKLEVDVGYGVSGPPTLAPGMKETFFRICPELKDRPYFIFLGRLHPKKGVDLLIKAYAETHTHGRNGPSAGTCLVVAGPGLDTDYGRKMRALAMSICPPGSVFWPEMLTGDAKWGAFYHAEAFVLASHQENFGIAVAEALSCGTPVLISNQINIWKEIEQDKAGFVSDDSLAGVQESFRQWISLAQEEKAAMKQAARACYENRFSIVRAAENLVDLLKRSTMNFHASNPY